MVVFHFGVGAIGGVVTGVAYCFWKKISALKMADIGAPAIMFGLASGRVDVWRVVVSRPVEGFVHHFARECILISCAIMASESSHCG